jgi:hypothetical protein
MGSGTVGKGHWRFAIRQIRGIQLEPPDPIGELTSRALAAGLPDGLAFRSMCLTM